MDSPQDGGGASLEGRSDDAAVLQAVLAAMGEGLVCCDGQGRITVWNRAAVAMTAWPAEEAMGRPFYEAVRLFDPLDRQAVENPVSRVLPDGAIIDGERALLCDRQDGERPVSISARAIVDAEGGPCGVAIILRDESEHLRLAERFREAQKMETVGRLAGGVAHDFNNLLCGIIGYADVLQHDLESDSTARRRIDAILEAASRAAELTQQLLDFSRPGRRSAEERIDCHRLIADVVAILSHTVEASIRIETDCSAVHHHCRGDAARLQAALLNLAINARDAMPEGGLLRFVTDNIPADAGAAVPFCLRIAVSDTGVGVDAALHGRIFEPFFTTKELGRGTGLGLASVAACMEEHGGTVRLSSVPDYGSTFLLTLPAIVAQVVEEPKTVQTIRAARPEPGALILVVDDEDIIRHRATDILTASGYRVLVAVNGKEAVQIFRESREPIRLALLDVVMPEMNGPTTRQKLREMNPRLPIIMCSGFAFDEVNDASREGRPCGYLQKPFNATALRQAVADQLGASVQEAPPSS